MRPVGAHLPEVSSRAAHRVSPAPLLVCLLVWGCGITTPPPVAPPPPNPAALQLELVQVAGGFTNPLDLQQPNDGSGRLFAVEQGGRIRIVDASGNVLPLSFLDITSRVSSGGETGLLGLAFHPRYSQNGCFYVNYTTTRFTGRLQTVIAEYQAAPANSNTAGTSENILFTVDQPAANHNGGGLAFGPDGMLYIGLGDGGGAGDPFLNGQRINTRLGKMLRVAVNCGGAYTVPADNPFAGQPSPTNEIWALGLRNPWRFSFDRSTGRLLAADVGQDKWEEIDIIQAGKNYGWNVMEGAHCFSPATGCNAAGLELPIAEYDHTVGEAVTGGYVYRGARMPPLAGTYVFGDYIMKKIFGLVEISPGNWQRSLLLQTNLSISSFGQDQAGELYVTDLAGGGVYRLRQVGMP
jgi:glucose/arabinose dehydrogenase